MNWRTLLLVPIFGSLILPAVRAAAPPAVPVGLDAYRQWERWPYHRIGARAYMRSTYDRTGGNEAADASHFLYQKADDFNVTLDVAGPGVLYFARYNHWHGSPWHYVVDGTDHIVSESSSLNPKQPVDGSVFLPAHLFPSPLTWTWSTTKGADLMWVPIPFESSFQMAYSRTHYGTGYYIYHQYVPGIPLSRPLQRWDGRSAPDADVLALLNRAGTDLAPADAATVEGGLSLSAAAPFLVANLTNGPAVIRALEFSAPRTDALAFGRARLQITWDNRPAPSIDAPLALFFGAGTLYNRDNREFLVRAFPVHIRFDRERVYLNCYFPMPYFKTARVELLGAENSPVPNVSWRVRQVPYQDAASDVGYFHATYRDHPQPRPGHDLVLLDTRQTEGGGDWSGQFVGTSWIFSHRNVLTTLEGDPRFFFDDSRTPQAYGTGTEEWGGGGDYWGGRNMTLPFAGHPVGARRLEEAQNAEDQIHSAYRFLLADLMPFGKNALIHLEHGGRNESTEHYETVTYWYGSPRATLLPTDTLVIGNPASETAHEYRSPDSSEPYTVTSRYEWGIDTLGPPAREVIFPAESETARKTTGASEFTLDLDPRHRGVLLRRKLDYQYPHQRAEVYVQHPETAAWEPAGIWFLAGSNTCVYSNPRDELGATEHHVQTSNRRLRDDEFLLPLPLTQGRSKIRLRVQFTPVAIPLFPGHPLPELAWTEMRYTAYCWVWPGE